MIGTILNVISGLFWAAGKLFEWLYANQLVDAGKTQQQLENLRKEIHDAQIAVAAREAVRASIAQHPDGIVPADDPFLRD
jgi:hypothetical protein